MQLFSAKTVFLFPKISVFWNSQYYISVIWSNVLCHFYFLDFNVFFLSKKQPLLLANRVVQFLQLGEFAKQICFSFYFSESLFFSLTPGGVLFDQMWIKKVNFYFQNTNCLWSKQLEMSIDFKYMQSKLKKATFATTWNTFFHTDI